MKKTMAIAFIAIMVTGCLVFGNNQREELLGIVNLFPLIGDQSLCGGGTTIISWPGHTVCAMITGDVLSVPDWSFSMFGAGIGFWDDNTAIGGGIIPRMEGIGGFAFVTSWSDNLYTDLLVAYANNVEFNIRLVVETKWTEKVRFEGRLQAMAVSISDVMSCDGGFVFQLGQSACCGDSDFSVAIEIGWEVAWRRDYWCYYDPYWERGFKAGPRITIDDAHVDLLGYMVWGRGVPAWGVEIKLFIPIKGDAQ